MATVFVEQMGCCVLHRCGALCCVRLYSWINDITASSGLCASVQVLALLGKTVFPCSWKQGHPNRAEGCSSCSYVVGYYWGRLD